MLLLQLSDGIPMETIAIQRAEYLTWNKFQQKGSHLRCPPKRVPLPHNDDIQNGNTHCGLLENVSFKKFIFSVEQLNNM